MLIKFNHNNCIATNGIGKLNIIANTNNIISDNPVDKSKYITFLILLYALLPSSTPFTIDEKLSSVIIIFPVSFAISVPLPIATPILADFRAGVSFTPSPVTATIFPSSFNFLTISNFSIGVALEYTLVIPILLAIASAVFFWSPVIIIVSIPAFLQLSTASVTPSLIGSTNPISPRNVISLRSFSSSSFVSKLLL